MNKLEAWCITIGLFLLLITIPSRIYRFAFVCLVLVSVNGRGGSGAQGGSTKCSSS